VLQELLAPLVHKDHKVFKGQLELMELTEQMALQAQLALLVQ
jgi:hypothetical protein